jgi:hypothetical protein
MGDADEGARSCARGGRAPHRAPSASAAARHAPRCPTPVATLRNLPLSEVHPSGSACAGANGGDAAAPGAADASLPSFVAFSLNPAEAAGYYRRLWRRYGADEATNTRDYWTSKGWLPSNNELTHHGDRRKTKLTKKRMDSLARACAAFDPQPADAPADQPKPKPPPRGVAAARANAQSSRQASAAALQRDATQSTRRSKQAEQDAARTAEYSEIVLASVRLARDAMRNFRYDDTAPLAQARLCIRCGEQISCALRP